MALTVWTQPSGSLGSFQEGLNFDLQLPVDNVGGVTYTVISGKLPGGLWLHNDSILGTPYEVARDTNFSFCIRASKNNQIADRTFTITITGPDEPVILTAAGLLDIGPSKQLFIVDESFVNYQLTAIDTDTYAGQKLTYFITEGELPPGLSLTPDGAIYGIVEAVTTLQVNEGNGTYDHGFFDAGPYDFASPQAQNGYDELRYDYIGYDYFMINQPRTLNRFYEFVVAVTDGDTINPPQRRFQIYVVNPDYFRADSESLISNSSVYTADVSYVQAPVWITSSDLGTYRANNYLTLVLNVFDTSSIYFRLEQVNALSVATAYRRSIYDNRIGSYTITTVDTTNTPQVGHYIKINGSKIFNRVTEVAQYTTNEYTLTVHSPLDVNITNGDKFFIGTQSELPPGMSFDSITGDVFGRVPAQSAITKTYNFTVTAIRIGDIDTSETNSASRIFTVKVIGEIDSVITWNTSSDLGRISAGYESLLTINATTSISNAIITYTITDGQLPPGLTLEYDGEITGKVSQFSNQVNFDNNDTNFDINTSLYRVTFDNSDTSFDAGSTKIGAALGFTTFNNSNRTYGLTSFDLEPSGATTFDNNGTTIDRIYRFTVTAADQYYYSASPRTFTLSIDVPNDINYSNIYVKPFMTPEHRSVWSKFIDDSSIFTPNSIYRPYDKSHGVQQDLSMLLYAGIETSNLGHYSQLTTETIKRFRFENVHKAIAYYPGTRTPVYEVLYVKMVDPLLENTLYNKDNVNVWRSQIMKMGDTRWDYLPLWMRSVQPDARMQLGFVLAVPLCFCKIGTADDIMLNIKHSEFDFKLLDYTVDRVIINKIIGDNTDKYIVFNNRNLQ